MLKLVMIVINVVLILFNGSGSGSGYKLTTNISMTSGHQTGSNFLATSFTTAVSTDSATVTQQGGAAIASTQSGVMQTMTPNVASTHSATSTSTNSGTVPSNVALASIHRAAGTSTNNDTVTSNVAMTSTHSATVMSTNSLAAVTTHSAVSVKTSSSSSHGTPVLPRIYSSISSPLSGINATIIHSSSISRLSSAAVNKIISPTATIKANASTQNLSTNKNVYTRKTASTVSNSPIRSHAFSSISATHTHSSMGTLSAIVKNSALPSHISINPSTNSVQTSYSYVLPSNISSTVISSSFPSSSALNAFMPTSSFVITGSISTLHPHTNFQSTHSAAMVVASSSLPTVRSVSSASSPIAVSIASVSPTGLTYLIPTAPTVVFPVPVKFPTTPAAPTTTTQSTPSVPACLYKQTCCRHGLRQLPASITFKESLHPGSVLARMKDVMNVRMAVFVANPPALLTILQDHFTMATTGHAFTLVLKHELDLEEVYIKANKKIDVHQFQIQIHCSENGVLYPSQLINVTVEDVDDSMPEFQHDGTGPSCVVPIYKAGADEEYTGELQISPGKIKAVDGDLTQNNNITYNVMHAEPDDYHEYFYVDTEDGTVNKTRTMNASDPRKFVIFVQATEDSPNQKNRVAILSIEVYAPLADNERPITVDPAVKSALQIISALLIIAFISGFLVILHHRWHLRKVKVGAAPWDAPGSEQDVRLPKLAVYKSSSSSINTLEPDIPVITSPSQVDVGTREKGAFQKQKKKIIVVKRPLDTRARPSWNAPPPRAKRVTYNPYVAVQKIKNQ